MADETNQEAESNHLREMAEALDASGGEPVSVEISEEHAPDPEKAAAEPVAKDGETSSSEITSEKKERARDASGKFIKTDAEKAADDEKAKSEKVVADKAKADGAPEKKDSEYVRKQKEKDDKEKARLDKTWQNVDTRKAELERKELELAERERRIASLPPQQAPRATKNGYTADEYETAAKEFIAANEPENAVKALAAATEVRQFEADYYRKAQVTAIEKNFQADMESVMKEHPETADPTHPIADRIQKILKNNPWLGMVPQGFSKAAQVAQLELGHEEDARVISELQDENKKLKAELEKRDSDTQLSVGGPSGGPRSKSLSEMSFDEAKRSLREAAEEYDSSAAA